MADKKRKKQWYEILASKHFHNIVIGECVAYEDKNLIGKVINTNLGNLTRDMKLQNVRLKFRVNEVKEGKAHTEVKGYGLATSYVKRIVRVGRSRIDDSFLITTKDNIKIRLKPLILTKHKTQKNVLKGMRGLVKNDFIEYVKKETYTQFVSDLISKKLQRDLRRKLSKIYPVSVVEVRVMTRT
tara:strand:+ start:1399 stop:1950 length:552 start_codon:yes stop_codon:yes gene_type:complete